MRRALIYLLRFLALEDETDRLFRKISNELLPLPAWFTRAWAWNKISTTDQTIIFRSNRFRCIRNGKLQKSLISVFITLCPSDCPSATILPRMNRFLQNLISSFTQICCPHLISFKIVHVQQGTSRTGQCAFWAHLACNYLNIYWNEKYVGRNVQKQTFYVQ